MSLTRTQLRRRIARALKEPFFVDIQQGYLNPTGGALVGRPNLWPNDQKWANSFVYVATGDNAGQERKIYNYAGATGAISVDPAFDDPLADDDEFEIHSRTPASEKNEAINLAIKEGWDAFYSTVTAEIVVPKDTIELTGALGLPTTIRQLLNVYLEPPRSWGGEYTATNGSTTTVEDSSQNWSVDEHVGKDVAFIDGTGKGQQTTITSNTATTLTFAAVVTAPGIGTTFIIKDPLQTGVWLRVRDIVQEGQPELTTIRIPIWLQSLPGRVLRIEGLGLPATLDSDSDTTEVPEEYIIPAALAILTERMGMYNPTHDWDVEKYLSQWYAQKTEAKRRFRWPRSNGTFWQPQRSVHGRWPHHSPLSGWRG